MRTSLTPAGTHGEYADVFRWDVVNWSRHIDVWEEALCNWRALYKSRSHSGRNLGLELGSDWGGGLSLWMALKGFEVVSAHYDVRGWQHPDLSYAQEARRVQGKYGVADRIRFERVDVLQMEFRERFDVIMLKSILGGLGNLPQQQRAVERIHAALRPGGLFLFAENLRATALHSMLRTLRRGDTWHYPRLEHLTSLMKGFRSLRYETTGVLGLLGFTEGQRRLLGKLDGGISKLTPETWRYVFLGAALK